jgi:hypothetical protein
MQSNAFKGPIFISLLVSVAVMFFCSKDYNPFDDLTNAKVHVLSWCFQGMDSVSIYATGTIKTVVALSEEVDSFKVSAGKNRFWSDTVIHRRPGPVSANGGPFLFPVSFFDTGIQTVTVMTFRSNGEVIPEEFSIRAVSPLHQRAVQEVYGVPFSVSTPKVADKDALYHWHFGPGREIGAVAESTSVTFTNVQQIQGKGALWVTDLSGNHPTPADSFVYSFNDTSKPVIYYFNDALNRDTLFAGDSLFVFRVHVIDNIDQTVDTCSVNGVSFELNNLKTNVYTKFFKNMSQYTRQNGPLAITVYAMDNQQFHNVANRTFWAFYDSSGAKNADAKVYFVVPGEDSVTYRVSNIVVKGSAENYRTQTMILHIAVNDSVSSDYRTIQGQSGDWVWSEVHLQAGRNKVTVTGYSTDNRFMASDTVSILFDPNFPDTIKPMIWQITTANGTPADGFTTSNDSETLKVIAFDEGSRIWSVFINGVTAQPYNSDGYTWTGTTGPLVHQSGGNSITVRVTDQANNFRDDTVFIKKNTSPVLIPTSVVPGSVCIDTAYSLRLIAYDADRDPVTFQWRHIPAGMTTATDGGLSWKPTATASGLDSMVVGLFDGYGEPRDTTFYFSIVTCGQVHAPVRFTTTELDFPTVLQAGVDTMSVVLATDKPPSGYTSHYSARFTDRNESIMLDTSSPHILWAPVETDTGYRRLLITVGDGSIGFDTLYPAIRVVHRNEYPCSLSYRFTGSRTAAGELDLFTHPAPETLYFTIRDNDNPLTEKYTVTITLRKVKTVEAITTRFFFVALRPDSTRMLDTLGVSILDMTDTRDSAQFIIRYDTLRANTVPVLLRDPQFPPYVCADSVYHYNIASYDPDNDLVDVVTLHAPGGMSVSKRGLVTWNPTPASVGSDSLVIVFYDQRAYSNPYRWPLTTIDCANRPPAVLFKTIAGDFPKALQAGVDSMVLQLQTVQGTGVKPFTFRARFIDNGAIVLDNDTNGALLWRPQLSDTGVRVIMVSVRDRYGTSDSIAPVISVAPPNRFPVSLAATYSGKISASGTFVSFANAQAESVSYIISDADNPLTEHYSVAIVKDHIQSTRELQGTQRRFSVSIGPATAFTRDTVTVAVQDANGTADTVRSVVDYLPSTPAQVPQLALSLTAQAGVTLLSGSATEISKWSDTSRPLQALVQSDGNRNPELFQNIVNGLPAIYFDHNLPPGTNVDDGLYNLTYGNWAAAPFTIIVVFNLNAVIPNTRQTLVSTNAGNGFGLGITCNGTIGMFNSTSASSCPAAATANSNLAVQARTWYVVTYESASGIGAGGNLQAQVWLNGTQAAQQMAMTNALPGSGLMIAAASNTNYYGSLGGLIASVTIYSRALTVTERQGVERLLGSIYGIAVQ